MFSKETERWIEQQFEDFCAEISRTWERSQQQDKCVWSERDG